MNKLVLFMCFVLLQYTFVKAQTPTLNCPANINVSNDTGDCGAIVNYTIQLVLPIVLEHQFRKLMLLD